MARTKPRKPQDHLTAEEKAAAAERCARRRGGIIKAARMLSPQETVKQPARVPSETEEDSETEPEEDTFTRPDPGANHKAKRSCARKRRPLSMARPAPRRR